MRIIKIGAEAVLYLSKWQSKKVVIKERIPKKYRAEAIDNMLRAERIKTEAKLMYEARLAGVHVPIIYDIDVSKNRITMEYIPGMRVKELLKKSSPNRVKSICKKIGILCGKLHKSNIIHGDLTTSNMIYSHNNIYLIDFSLGMKSSEIEDKGADMHLLKEAFTSAHSELPYGFECVVEEYKKDYKDGEKVIEKVFEIEKRGRYL